MRRFHVTAAALSSALAGAAWAQPQVTLFDTVYNVQRFDYSLEVAYQDPSDCLSSGIINLTQAEGITWLGSNRALMSSRDMDLFNSYEHQIVEVQFDTDGSGNITGLSFVRTVVLVDTSPTGDPLNCGLGSPFGLNSRGVSINTGSVGLGAGGDVLVFSGNEVVHGYDLATGAYLPNGVDFVNGFSINPPNDNCDDGCFVAGRDEFYTVWQAGPRVERFTTKGVYVSGFAVANGAFPSATGDAKGITYVPDTNKYPTLFQGEGGVVIVALDELGPALQAFDLDGTLLRHEPLSLDVGGGALQIESLTTDPDTGRIFLVNQNASFVDDFIWVLTPEPTGCPNNLPGCDNSDLFPSGGDCIVNLGDLGQLLANYQPGVGGKTRDQGDIFPLSGGDGIVDLGDLGQVLSDFNTNCQ